MIDNFEDYLGEEWCEGGEYVCTECGEFYSTQEFIDRGGENKGVFHNARCECENEFTITRFINE